MTQIGKVPGIIAIKDKLTDLKEHGLLTDWEVPYENLLTRSSAAVFFLTPASATDESRIWEQLGAGLPEGRLQYQRNTEKKLSRLEWQVEFK